MTDYPNPFKVRQYDSSDVSDVSRDYPIGMGRLKRFSKFLISLAFVGSALYAVIDSGSKVLKSNSDNKNSNNNNNYNKNGKR